MEKQFNIWNIQDELQFLHAQKQLDRKLKVLRDQYVGQVIVQSQQTNKTLGQYDVTPEIGKCDHCNTERTRKKHHCTVL
jgi:hypothetical protein